jgi:serine/threonine protein kinase
MSKEPSQNSVQIGALVSDRYRIDEVIARGGMATVYLAQDVRLKRPIALKMLRRAATQDDASTFKKRFVLEAETLGSLDHPNIVILHDFGLTEQGRYFLAMEYVGGRRLSDILKAGPLPSDRTLNYITQLSEALHYAHAHGVIHRDLKPSNILVKTRENGHEQIKVVDFGLVKINESEQSITRSGYVLGSPHCMAPEQVKGLAIDHRADIYATGILLFRCLTGKYPFHGDNITATMVAHLQKPIPRFKEIASTVVVPDGIEDVVRKCLQKEPQDRYTDMASLRYEISQCLSIPAVPLNAPKNTTAPQAIKDPAAPKWVGVLLVVVVAFAALAITLAVAALTIALLNYVPINLM